MTSFFQLKAEHRVVEKKNIDNLAIKKRKRKEKEKEKEKEKIYELPERILKAEQQNEERAPVYNFNVTLRRFALRDLSSKKIHAFLEGNFDHFKSFRTPIVSNEVYGAWWGCQFSFVYYTKFIHKLHNKFLEIDVFEKGLLQHIKIGSVKIELDSLALGPVFHDLMVINGNNVDVGRLEFECVMEQENDVKISLEDVWFHFGKKSIDKLDESRTTKNYGKRSIGGLLELSAPPTKQDLSQVYLHVSFSPQNSEEENFQSNMVEDLSTQGWPQITMLRKTTLKKLKSTKLLVELKEKRAMGVDKIVGVCWIPFKKYLLLRARPTKIPFAVQLERVRDENLVMHPQNFHLLAGRGLGKSQVSSTSQGILRGFVVFENLPIKAQLVGGRHTENGVFGGELLFEGLSFPKIYRGNKNYNGDSEEEADEVRNADFQHWVNEEPYQTDVDYGDYNNGRDDYYEENVDEDEVDVNFGEELQSKTNDSSLAKLGITITPPFENTRLHPLQVYTKVNATTSTITNNNHITGKTHNYSEGVKNEWEEVANNPTPVQNSTLPKEKINARTQSYSQFFNPFSNTAHTHPSISSTLLTHKTLHFVSSTPTTLTQSSIYSTYRPKNPITNEKKRDAKQDENKR